MQVLQINSIQLIKFIFSQINQIHDNEILNGRYLGQFKLSNILSTNKTPTWIYLQRKRRKAIGIFTDLLKTTYLGDDSIPNKYQMLK